MGVSGGGLSRKVGNRVGRREERILCLSEPNLRLRAPTHGVSRWGVFCC